MKSTNVLLRRCAEFGILASLLLALGVGNAQTSAPPMSKSATSATKTQSELANPKIALADIPEKDKAVTAALDAHNLASAKALIGKSGSLTGTVSGIYAPKSNKLVILNFDRDYKTAVSAVVEAENFAKFPDLKTLSGKRVVVSGKFVAFRETAELMITQPSEIKIIK